MQELPYGGQPFVIFGKPLEPVLFTMDQGGGGMTFKTLEGTLFPNGQVALPQEDLPTHPVRVMVTLMEPSEDISLAELGDYQQQLTDYEERLARGEIHWQ
jgi:hypothetical protein